MLYANCKRIYHWLLCSGTRASQRFATINFAIDHLHDHLAKASKFLQRVHAGSQVMLEGSRNPIGQARWAYQFHRSIIALHHIQITKVTLNSIAQQSLQCPNPMHDQLTLKLIAQQVSEKLTRPLQQSSITLRVYFSYIFRMSKTHKELLEKHAATWLPSPLQHTSKIPPFPV